MPQVSPFWWPMMFIMFMTSLLIIIFIMFYLTEVEATLSEMQEKSTKMINWKW